MFEERQGRQGRKGLCEKRRFQNCVMGKSGGKIRKWDRIILTELKLRIENTKACQDRINNRISVSYPTGASNRGYE
jgi:hypothetical protein